MNVCMYTAYILCLVSNIGLMVQPTGGIGIPDFGKFKVLLNKDGGYHVTIADQLWLRSAPTFFTLKHKDCTVKNECLKLTQISSDNGFDSLGGWNMTSFTYTFTGTTLKVKAMVKYYPEQPIVLFGQHFPASIEGSSVGDPSAVSSGFPSFYMESAEDLGRHTELGYLSYGGIMTGDTKKSIGVWNNGSKMESGMDSGPLVLFDKTGNAIIISSFTNFMSASVQYKKRSGAMTATWGLLGAADHVPEDFTYWTSITYSDKGINKLMSSWGALLRCYYNKDKSFTESDWTNNYLGYWTDRGGYYYYATEEHKNYEDTILDIKRHSDEEGIPYRYIEYDSWFYPKDPQRGVTEWTSMMKIFPKGIRNVWYQTGWPVVGHNRWWSNETVYAKQNGGKYNFVTEKSTGKALPLDQDFWDDLMNTAKMWGLVSYEQDWLNRQFDEMNATVESLTLGRQWLHQMAKAATKNGIFIQYCMAPSRHALTSLELPIVTQSRVSQDYLPGLDNWKIGITSMFADALGVAPYKDNFWTTRVQPGNIYNGTEDYADLHVLVATLSTGPVSPSDKIGYMNKTLIMRSCNKDGLILKPSKPATAIDKQLISAAFSSFRGEVWSTYSTISGVQFGIILGANFSKDDKISIRPMDVNLDNGGIPVRSLQAFYWKNFKTLTRFSDDNPVVLHACSNTHFCLIYASPELVIQGRSVVVLGEMDKFVPMSPKRISSITMTTDDIELSISGAVGESVTMTMSVDNKLKSITCSIGHSGTVLLSVMFDRCI